MLRNLVDGYPGFGATCYLHIVLDIQAEILRAVIHLIPKAVQSGSQFQLQHSRYCNYSPVTSLLLKPPDVLWMLIRSKSLEDRLLY